MLLAGNMRDLKDGLVEFDCTIKWRKFVVLLARNVRHLRIRSCIFNLQAAIYIMFLSCRRQKQIDDITWYY